MSAIERQRRFWNRSAKTESRALPFDSEVPYRTSWSSRTWRSSLLIGKLSLTVIAGTGALYLYDADLFRRMNPAGFLPEPVQQFYSSDRALVDSAEFQRLESQAKRQVREAVGRGREAKGDFFTLGSDEEQVLRVQGKPVQKSGAVWRYGDSEVHFVAGRVAAWKSSPGNPLRAK